MRCINCMQPIQGEPSICPHCGYALHGEVVNERCLPPGTRLQRYELGRVLGAGGFGITYVAWDDSLRRRVAIKEYFPSNVSTRAPGSALITALSGEKEKIYGHGLNRFIEEAQLLKRFADYDGIVSVYDVFEANGTAYMVMEYLEGVTLKTQLAEFGRLSEDELLDRIVPMLLSLKFVHMLDYAHRDIAPDNIMCLPDGSVKLMDFGAARYAVMEQSHSLSVIVKQGYTPVEQYQTHGRQGPWTDVYAVGAVMYHALTGQLPPNSLDRLSNDTIEPISRWNDDVSPNTEAAIMSALNVRPEERPQDLDAFLAILLGVEPSLVQGKRRKRLSGVAIGVITAAVILGLCGAAGAIWHVLRPSAPAANTVNVPNIVGETIETAETRLSDQQLALQITGGRYYSAELVDLGFVAEGQIMTQDPTSGTVVDLHSTVGAEVSKGKEQIYLPPVDGMMQETGLAYLEQCGVEDEAQVVIVEEISDTVLPGGIISQSVAPGEGVDYDTTITLTVSAGPSVSSSGGGATSDQGFAIPDLTGVAYEDAQAQLLAHGIYLVKSAVVYSPEVAYGAIVTQQPAAGTELTAGDAVYVVASLGIEQARVPDVRYLPLAEAQQALAEAGLSWSVSYAVDPVVAVDHVITQEIDAGRQVAFGTVIALTVSQTEPLPEDVPPSERVLVISPDELTLTVNTVSDPLRCAAENVQWYSSDPTIASVTEEGAVEAHRYGYVTIIANADGAVATCAVRVEDEDATPGRLSRVLKVGETLDGAQIATRANLVWRSTDPTIATVDSDGLISALTPGTTLITAAGRDALYGIFLTVEPDVTYTELSRKTILSGREAAEALLKQKDLAYTVEESEDDSGAPGTVLRFDYTGYTDEDNFYVEEGTTSTLVVVPEKPAPVVPATPAYITVPKSQVLGTGAAADAALTALGVPHNLTYGYSDTIAEGNVRWMDYTGSEDKVNYYLTYGTYATIHVSLGKNTVASIAVSQNPKQMSYNVGDTPVYTGMQLTVTYRDGTTEKITTGYSAPNSPLTQSPSQTVTISYGGCTTTLTFQVQGTKGLSVKTYPTKQTYYIGDKLDTSGMVLLYNNGSTKKEVTSGFTATADLWEAGSRTVTVTYQGLTTTFEVTVKTPSVTLTKDEQPNGALGVFVTTDPAGQPVLWATSNRSVLDIQDGHLVPVSAGVATISATMTYNGINYTGTVDVNVTMPEEEYTFEIVCRESIAEFGHGTYSVSSNIPKFDSSSVTWSAQGSAVTEYGADGGFFHVDGDFWNVGSVSITITASYVYNGRTYTDTYVDTIESCPYYSGDYAFDVVVVSEDTDTVVYAIQTDIPNFNPTEVNWSVTLVSGTMPDWTVNSSGQLVIYKTTGGSGYELSIYATYVYRGVTYTA